MRGSSGSCVNTDTGSTGDIGGDMCDWYDSYGGCDSWNDGDFTASDMCCSCGGGQPECIDTNLGTADTAGDPCANYNSGNADYWCGNYDDDDFFSNMECCACGGGDDGDKHKQSYD